MQAIEWLLEVKAIPFTERALGIQLLIASKEGGPTADYHIAMARLKLQKRELSDAEEELNEALQLDYQVCNLFILRRLSASFPSICLSVCTLINEPVAKQTVLVLIGLHVDVP